MNRRRWQTVRNSESTSNTVMGKKNVLEISISIFTLKLVAGIVSKHLVNKYSVSIIESQVIIDRQSPVIVCGLGKDSTLVVVNLYLAPIIMQMDHIISRFKDELIE